MSDSTKHTETNQFTKTIITLEILSENPIPETYELEDIIHESRYGEFVLSMSNNESVSLSNNEMAKELSNAGSQPEFFNLNEDDKEEDTEQLSMILP
jgi:hypothetical protein